MTDVMSVGVRAAIAWEAGAPLSFAEVDLHEQCRLGYTPYCDDVVALDTTGNPDVVMAAVHALATHGTCSVITSSGAPLTVPPGALLLRGRKLRGTVGGHINPTVFIPRLLDLHARGRFPFDRLVRNYPFADLRTAMADSLSGATGKPVLTFTC
jgi:aryl-alcohol dehydrogenase